MYNKIEKDRYSQNIIQRTNIGIVKTASTGDLLRLMFYFLIYIYQPVVDIMYIQ